jgi:hypothetical protein
MGSIAVLGIRHIAIKKVYSCLVTAGFGSGATVYIPTNALGGSKKLSKCLPNAYDGPLRRGEHIDLMLTWTSSSQLPHLVFRPSTNHNLERTRSQRWLVFADIVIIMT